MPRPDISIVIPTFNRLDRLKRVLGAVSRQDFAARSYEVIVVSDGSSDGTNEYLASQSDLAQLKPMYQPNRGPAAARNSGITAAQGALIVFIDDDVIPIPTLLTEHVQSHRNSPRDIAVIGPLLTPAEFKLSPWVNWEQEMLVKQYSAMQRGDWNATPRQFYTGNASIRRDVLLAAGGFDETFRRAEDVELAYRLAERGVEFVFNASAIGWHYAERSFRSWSDAAYAYGRNDAVFARDRNQAWLLSVIRQEFSARRLPLRQLIKSCLNRPFVSAGAQAGMRGLAGIAGLLGLSPIEVAAYSGIFGIRYYQGFVDEIGEVDFL
ncbi:MAG: glycosyltransferase family 2 protein [Hyphomicrobiaceae bacterium]|uniref:glycosyltransferase family 2 protein n=1 Tax=Pseudorhodoplanes sp. TaxID=1934341 RepID=UPI003D0DB4F5